MNGLEAKYTSRNYGEFLYMIFFIFFGNLIFLIPFYWNSYLILKTSFIMSITYIYCKRNPNVTFMFMMIFKVKAIYFIWIDFAQIVLFQSLAYAVSGLVVGHLYIYFKDILPVSHGKNYLKTPKFIDFLAQKFLKLTGEEEEVPRNVVNRENVVRNNFRGGNEQQGFNRFQGRGMRIG